MSIDPNSRYKQGPSGAGDWLMQFLGRGGRSNGPKGMENRAAGMRDYKAPNSTPWGERSGALGVNKGDWLQAGLGMLAGRNMQDGFYNVAGVAGNAMDRRRTEDKDEQRKQGIIAALGTQYPKERNTLLTQYAPEEMLSRALSQVNKKPLVVNGVIVDPDTYEPLADFRKDKAPAAGMIQDESGNWIYDPDYLEGQERLVGARGSNEGNVQSTFTAEDGMQYIVRRDGTTEPLGVRARNPFQITDVGGVPTAINRQTGEGMAVSTPEEVGGNASTIATIQANEAARNEAQQALPTTIANATISLDTIDNLLASPGFESRYGLVSIVPAIAGTEMANTQALIDQINGQVFLDAFKSLKGGGQITEIEGEKATVARSRLVEQSITPTAAREAAQELRDIVAKGIERAKAQAAGRYAPLASDAPALKYNPETGDFE